MVVQVGKAIIVQVLLNLALEIIAGDRQRVCGAKDSTHTAADIRGWVDVDEHHHTPCMILSLTGSAGHVNLLEALGLRFHCIIGCRYILPLVELLIALLSHYFIIPANYRKANLSLKP